MAQVSSYAASPIPLSAGGGGYTGARSPRRSAAECRATAPPAPAAPPLTAFGRRAPQKGQAKAPPPRSCPPLPAQPPPANLLSIGGREGAGQRINGDYELLEGHEMHGRPCWLRRGRLANIGETTGGQAGDTSSEAGADGIDERPLYLFFSGMGYWTIAPSLHASGVQVFARNGPDFSAFSPDAVSGTWMVLLHGKLRPDPSVVCFRHDILTHRPPEILHLSGCRGEHGQLNGLYHLAEGVIVGSRPVFIKDGLKGAPKDEKRLFHFSQRTGRWLLSSAVAAPRKPSFDDEEASIQWSDVAILARSPVAWTSMSPVHLLPREPWAIRKELPSRLRGGFGKHRTDAPVEFESSPEMRVAQWTGSAARYPADDIDVPIYSPTSPRSVASDDDGLDSRSFETAGVLREPDQTPLNMLCIHLSSPQGLQDPYAINGDYVRSAETYANRPVYIKLPVTGRSSTNDEEVDGKLFLFFDDMTWRWYVARQIGAAESGVARSAQLDHSDFCLRPPLEDTWQLRVEPNGFGTGLSLGAKLSRASFTDWHDLKVFALAYNHLPRTLMFGGESSAHALAGHVLSGDFRLVKERYGRRPVYKRAAQIPLGTPTVFLFFEPRSGYWVISTGSPFVTEPVLPDAGAPGLFGEVFARSGPAWTAFTPDVAENWEVFDRHMLSHDELLQYSGRAPDSVLSPLLKSTPWLKKHHLHVAAPPRWLSVSGFAHAAKVVNGTYELLGEAKWSSRPAWIRVDNDVSPEHAAKHLKYIFFWPETGHWIIGSELHVPHSALARSGPGCWLAETPEQCPGRWGALKGSVFEDHAHGCIRRQKTAAGGVISSGLSPLASPRQAFRDRTLNDTWSEHSAGCRLNPNASTLTSSRSSMPSPRSQNVAQQQQPPPQQPPQQLQRQPSPRPQSGGFNGGGAFVSWRAAPNPSPSPSLDRTRGASPERGRGPSPGRAISPGRAVSPRQRPGGRS